MARAIPRAAVVASLAAGLAACSLITTLGDLGASDGGTDASLDVASDVIAITDAGPSDAPFCKRADHTLCDDFDELPLGALWSSQHVVSATLVLDDDAAVSPPRSLVASVPDAQAGSAYLQRDFTGSASRVTCQFDARMDSLGTVPILSFSLGLSSTDPSRPGYNITFLHTFARTSYSEWVASPDGGGSSTSADLPPLPVGLSTFTHVVIDMNFGGGAIAVTYDGASVLATSLAAPPNSGQTVSLGVIEYIATPATLHFDNVACDLTP
jgi:hypothetical protein